MRFLFLEDGAGSRFGGARTGGAAAFEDRLADGRCRCRNTCSSTSKKTPTLRASTVWPGWPNSPDRYSARFPKACSAICCWSDWPVKWPDARRTARPAPRKTRRRSAPGPRVRTAGAERRNPGGRPEDTDPQGHVSGAAAPGVQPAMPGCRKASSICPASPALPAAPIMLAHRPGKPRHPPGAPRRRLCRITRTAARTAGPAGAESAPRPRCRVGPGS